MFKLAQYLKESKRYVAYHGSPRKFTTFNFKNIGIEHGTDAGRGIYFTNNIKNALAYANNGYIYHVDIDLKKPLDTKRRIIKRNEIKKLIESNPDKSQLNGMLSNWGDVDYEGYNTILDRAIEAYDDEQNDLDLVNVIGNDMFQGDWLNYFKTLRKALGYDGLIDYKGSNIHYIVFNPDQITIKKVEKLK